MSNTIRTLDQNALKTGQALTFLLLVAGYVFNSWHLVAFVGLCQLLGALNHPFAPFRLAYEYVIKPAGLIKPRIEADNPEPHRFSMLIGTIFNWTATVAFWLNAPTFAWILVAIVIILANVNFWLNFCVGCWFYYRLNRLGVRGFTASEGV